MKMNSIINSVDSAVCINNIFIDPEVYKQKTSIYNNSMHPGVLFDTLHVIDIMNQFFMAPESKYIDVVCFPFIYDYTGLIRKIYGKEYLIYLKTRSFAMVFNIGYGNTRFAYDHDTSLFECDNKLYYYDDNYGLYEIDRDHFDDFLKNHNLSTQRATVQYTIKNGKFMKVIFKSIGRDEPILDRHIHVIHNILFLELISMIRKNYIKYKKINSILSCSLMSQSVFNFFDKNISHYSNDVYPNKEVFEKSMKNIEERAKIKNENRYEELAKSYAEDLILLLEYQYFKINLLNNSIINICDDVIELCKREKDQYMFYYLLLACIINNSFNKFIKNDDDIKNMVLNSKKELEYEKQNNIFLNIYYS